VKYWKCDYNWGVGIENDRGIEKYQNIFDECENVKECEIVTNTTLLSKFILIE